MQKHTISMQLLFVLFLTVSSHNCHAAAYGKGSPTASAMDTRVDAAEFKKYVKSLKAKITLGQGAATVVGGLSNLLGNITKKPGTPKAEKEKTGLEVEVDKAAYLERYLEAKNEAIKNRAIDEAVAASTTGEFIGMIFQELHALPIESQTQRAFTEILHRKNVQSFGLPEQTTYQQLYDAVTAKDATEAYVIIDDVYFANTTLVLMALHVDKKNRR